MSFLRDKVSDEFFLVGLRLKYKIDFDFHKIH